MQVEKDPKETPQNVHGFNVVHIIMSVIYQNYQAFNYALAVTFFRSLHVTNLMFYNKKPYR
jgi:hypothetical protein